METLVAKARRMPERRRHLALASGARSAFDISGLSTINDEVLRSRLLKPGGPAEMIARDMARVMDRFGRSAAYARRTLETGLEIEDLEPGFTLNGDSHESLPHHHRSHGIPHESID